MTKDTTLRFRVDADDLTTIQTNADTAGLKVGAYIRAAATRREIKSSVEVRILAELRRVGGMVKRLWAENRHEEAAAIRAGLTAIKKAVEEAGRDGR